MIQLTNEATSALAIIISLATSGFYYVVSNLKSIFKKALNKILTSSTMRYSGVFILVFIILFVLFSAVFFILEEIL